MTKLWNRFVSEESGQGMVEYGLIIALISVVVVVVLGFIGKKLLNTFENINANLP
jgi:pilus assembly protein Flp/PilA